MRFLERGRELIAAQVVGEVEDLRVVDVVDLNNPCCFVLQCQHVYNSLNSQKSLHLKRHLGDVVIDRLLGYIKQHMLRRCYADVNEF